MFDEVISRGDHKGGGNFGGSFRRRRRDDLLAAHEPRNLRLGDELVSKASIILAGD